MKQILVTRSSLPDFEEYMEEIRPIWESRWLTNMGPKHAEFAQALREYLGVERLELFTNGHMAIELTLQALGLKGEVITTPFTFASTTHTIVRNGLEPVFCDIDPETFTLDPGKIEERITDKTCAILPVHVYGNICDTEGIEAVARRHGLKVIYDACHTFGETVNGRGAGQHQHDRRRRRLLPGRSAGDPAVRAEELRHPRAGGGQRCRRQRQDERILRGDGPLQLAARGEGNREAEGC